MKTKKQAKKVKAPIKFNKNILVAFVAVAALTGVYFVYNSFAMTDPGGGGGPTPVCTATLQKGSTNKTCVLEAQRRLNWYCKNDLTLNGVFDNTMYWRVRGFQYVTYLNPDGIIGPNTWKVLNQKYLVADQRDKKTCTDYSY